MPTYGLIDVRRFTAELGLSPLFQSDAQQFPFDLVDPFQVELDASVQNERIVGDQCDQQEHMVSHFEQIAACEPQSTGQLNAYANTSIVPAADSAVQFASDSDALLQTALMNVPYGTLAFAWRHQLIADLVGVRTNSAELFSAAAFFRQAVGHRGQTFRPDVLTGRSS